MANGPAPSALAPGHFLFTSESVGEGHPGTCSSLKYAPSLALNCAPLDKICDQVSDAIVSRHYQNMMIVVYRCIRRTAGCLPRAGPLVQGCLRNGVQNGHDYGLRRDLDQGQP